MKKLKYIFMHGGPGFCSNPEVQILTHNFSKKGSELVGWNAPSPLRQDENFPFSEKEAFRNSVESVKHTIQVNSSDEDGVFLIAHSYSTLIITCALQEMPTLVSGLVLIAPVTNDFEANDAIFSLAMMDLQESSPESVRQIQKLREKSAGKFDSNTIEAFKVAATDQLLLTHYWNKKELMATYFQHMEGSKHQFCMDAFISTKNTSLIDTVDSNASVLDIPTIAVFGKHDPVVSHQSGAKMLKERFSNLDIHIFEESAHYPHIEETERFLNVII